MPRQKQKISAFIRLLAVLSLAGCASGELGLTPGDETTIPGAGQGADPTGAVPTGSVPTGTSGDGNDAVFAFYAVPRPTALRKAKLLLTGALPTEAEISGYNADEGVLRRYIASWMQTPAYRAILQNFFAVQFQQSQIRFESLQNGLYDGISSPQSSAFANLQESFARTAMALIDEGRPFTETMTTTRHMLTTRLMVYYAYSDLNRRDDRGNISNRWWAPRDKLHGVTFVQKSGPLTLAQAAANPNGANWLTFYLPDLDQSTVNFGFGDAPAGTTNDICRGTDPLLLYDSRVQAYAHVWGPSLVLGYLDGSGIAFILPDGNSSGHRHCNSPGGNQPWHTAADGNDWRMVEVRAPGPGERVREFFDLDNIRNSNVLLMEGPRVGFFTTPAFLGQWSINAGNSARGATNQALIVALGHQIDGNDRLPLTSPTAVDPNHAAEPACFACHEALDPMRQFLRQSFTLTYSPQTDVKQAAIPAQFQFRGHAAAGNGAAAFGAALASHPDFAVAWTVKLCSWANSGTCVAEDPEVQRVAAVFAASKFDWPTLVVEMFSSPLVTYAKSTVSAQRNGQVSSIVRRHQLCRLLGARLQLGDVCALSTAKADGANSVPSRTAAMPQDGYSRGVQGALYVAQPDPFYLSNVENVCALVAARVIDGDTGWATSSNTPGAVAKLVTDLVGASGADATELEGLLQGHVDAARTAGASATNALRSAFVAACSSAAVASVGQ